MEIWDLYDGQRRPLGATWPRGRALPPGAYHIVVSVWTFNSRGEILLTLRSPQKPNYPNLWENTGGSALAGETSAQAAVRELFEETGLSCREEELIALGSNVSGCSLVDIYMLCKDAAPEDMRMQPGETVAAKWVSSAALEAMIADGSVAAPVAGDLRPLRSKFDLIIKEHTDAFKRRRSHDNVAL